MAWVTIEDRERPAVLHRNCVVCGRGSETGLRIDFRTVSAGRVEAVWHPEPAWCGYDGMLHGGIAAAMLDDAMVHALFSLGIAGVTAALELRYHLPVRTDAPVSLAAWRMRTRHRLHFLESSLVQNRRLCVHASARFLAKPDTLAIHDHD